MEDDRGGFLMICEDVRPQGSLFLSRIESSRQTEWFVTKREANARADEKFQASKNDGFSDVSNELTN